MGLKPRAGRPAAPIFAAAKKRLTLIDQNPIFGEGLIYINLTSPRGREAQFSE